MYCPGRFLSQCLPAAGRVERLWRTVKYQDIYIKDYETVEDLKKGLRNYFWFYNNERPHQSLGDKTPAEVYCNELQFRKAA